MGRRDLVGSDVLLGFNRSVALLLARKARDRIFELPDDSEVSFVLPSFDRRIGDLPDCIELRSFGWFGAPASAPACFARLQVWPRTPRLRMGFHDHVWRRMQKPATTPSSYGLVYETARLALVAVEDNGRP